MIASADMKAFRGFGLRDEFGAGLQILSDKAGDIAYKYNGHRFDVVLS